MKIYELYLNLFNNPFTAKVFRDLEQYYRSQGMTHEADAFGKLVTIRLQNDRPYHPNSSTEQSGTT